MEIIKPQNNVEQIKDKVKSIDDSILEQIADIAITIKRNKGTDKIYSKFYKSEYIPVINLARKDVSLTAKLNILQAKAEEETLIRTFSQSKEYNWIQILGDEIGEIAYGFYLAPDPNNMYELIDEIVMELIEERVPANIKYQQEKKFGECDRIVIYSDEANKDKIENCLAKVSNNVLKLFNDSERALPWLYKSKVPEVYLAPEKPGVSYEQEFIKAIIESKEIFCYLQEITGEKPLKDLENNYDRRYLKQIIASTLLRNGLLPSDEGRKITYGDDKISTTYDYITGKLTNSNKGQPI